MKSRWRFNIGIVKIGVLFLAVLITSCNALKRVEEDEYLLTKNNILVNEEKVIEEDIQSLIVQRPNSSLLGYPLRLNLYNLAKKDPDSSFQDWLHRKPKREQRLTRLLSKKQVERLGQSFLVKGSSEWLKSIGEPPSIVDSTNIQKSLQRLSAYYGSKGYFNNTTSYDIEPTKRKQRAEVNYKVSLGKPYIIDTLTKRIASKAIDSLYELHKAASFIGQGKQFDLADFNKERERLTILFRNSGVHNFQESSITYDILRDTAQLRDDQKMDVELNIENLRRRGDSAISSAEYKVHRFEKINIYADYQVGQDPNSLQSVDYEDYTIYFQNKLRYKPKAIVDAIFLKKDSVYRDIDRLRTYRQITNLNTFKYPNIEFIEDSTQTRLLSNIYLAARPKYSLGVNFDVTHSNIQTLGVGFSTSLITRNVFGGAETLSLSARGTFGLLNDQSLPEDFFSEIGGDINLTFPRIWFPLINTKKVIPNYMLPQTRVSAGTSFQKNIGLDRQTFNNIFGYSWSPDDFRRNTVELLNIQFVRNVNPERFFNVYQNTYERLDEVADDYQDPAEFPELADFFELPENSTDPRLIRPDGDPDTPDGTAGFISAILDEQVPSSDEDFREVSQIEERRIRLTENNLIFASNYTFSKNNRVDINDNNFYQFRFKLESAGNLLAGISNIIEFEKK